MAFFSSPKPSQYESHDITLPPLTVHHLLQNCDLPPPLKVFFFASSSSLSSSSSSSSSSSKQEWLQRKTLPSPPPPHMCMGTGESSRGILMRAMQLSQSRAREAENRAVMASEMVVRESVKLCAYKHWVKMLEIRVLVLEKEKRSLCEVVEPSGVSLCFVLALCFGVAGMGFIIGRSTCFEVHAC